MSEQIHLYADAFLMMASLGAAIYCLRIRQALKRMQRLDRGIGAAVTALQNAVSQSEEANARLKFDMATALRDLDQRYGRMQATRQEVDDLLDTMEGQMNLQVRRCQEARQVTEDALTPLVRRAELEITALTKSLEMQARMNNLGASRHADPRPPRPSSLTDELLPNDNPFLRTVHG